MSTTYPQLKKGGMITLNPVSENFKFACCDCGLIHTLDFKIIKNMNIEMTVTRDNRATGQYRRWRKK